MRSITPANCGVLLLGACAALTFEVAASFPLFFAPGWANGWPGGPTIYQVWSTWLTFTVFVLLVTIGLCAGALLSLLVSIFPRTRRYNGNMLIGWMVVWTVLCAAFCLRAFREIYASTLEMWPNGYPG
jgi:hypothetical protein